MTGRTPIEALLFDLDNTLVDRTASVTAFALDLVARHPAAFPEATRQADLAEWRSRDGLGYEHPLETCRWVTGRFPALGLTADALWAEFRERLPGFVTPDPRVAALLEGLARRFRLGLVSNGDGALQRRKLERAGLARFFPTPFLSGEFGADKPARSIFAAAVAAAGVDATRTLFVGDHPTHDVAGAAAAGLATCWVSHGRTFPADLPAPTFTVTRVTHLPEVLA